MAVDRYSSNLKCPKCLRTGTVDWQEPDGWISPGSFYRLVVGVSVGFEEGVGEKPNGFQRILCSTCKEQAN